MRCFGFEMYNIIKHLCHEYVILETVAKKVDWPKIRLIMKIPQFLHNQADIQAILLTHVLVIFTKFHYDSVKINNIFLGLLSFLCTTSYKPKNRNQAGVEGVR